MSSRSKETLRKYWIYFAISTAIMIALLVVLPQWFWVALPFSLTYLVLAFDAM